MLVRNTKEAHLMFMASFLNFAGYYAFLIVLSNVGMIALSRNLTIPIRILILGCLFFILASKREIYSNNYVRLFLVFCTIYIARIFAGLLGSKSYHIDPTEILLYFLSFGVLPVLALSSLKLKANDYRMIRKAILFSCLLLSGLTLFFYNNLVGTVGRISQAVSKDENYISPLALSYCGTLGIGIGLSYLMENKVSLRERILTFATILFSLIPFYLGASRGSIFSLFIPFIIMFLSKQSAVAGIRVLIIMLVVGIAGIYLSEMFGSSIVDRFTSIESDISRDNTSAVRLDMWRYGLGQFADNPVFGNSLEVDKFKFHPHNIIIEVLLSTGIIGFIPFALLMVSSFRKVIRIFREQPQYAWLGVIFVQSFIQNMFSGSIYGSSWTWFSLGLLFSFDMVKEKSDNNVVYYN